MNIGETVMGKRWSVIRAAMDIRPMLGLLESGRFIRGVATVFFRTVAIAIGVVLVVFWFRSWPLIQDLGWRERIAFTLWQIAFPYASFMALQVLYRCIHADENRYGSDYVVTPLLARLTRAHGEMAFVFLGLMSVPAMLMTWMGGATIMRHVNWLETENIFFAGIATFLFAWSFALLALIGSRFIAECIFAFLSMAHDLSILRKKSFTIDSGTVAKDHSSDLSQ
jgi:hypothetical protein